MYRASSVSSFPCPSRRLLFVTLSLASLLVSFLEGSIYRFPVKTNYTEEEEVAIYEEYFAFNGSKSDTQQIRRILSVVGPLKVANKVSKKCGHLSGHLIGFLLPDYLDEEEVVSFCGRYWKICSTGVCHAVLESLSLRIGGTPEMVQKALSLLESETHIPEERRGEHEHEPEHEESSSTPLSRLASSQTPTSHNHRHTRFILDESNIVEFKKFLKNICFDISKLSYDPGRRVLGSCAHSLGHIVYETFLGGPIPPLGEFPGPAALEGMRLCEEFVGGVATLMDECVGGVAMRGGERLFQSYGNAINDEAVLQRYLKNEKCQETFGRYTASCYYYFFRVFIKFQKLWPLSKATQVVAEYCLERYKGDTTFMLQQCLYGAGTESARIRHFGSVEHVVALLQDNQEAKGTWLEAFISNLSIRVSFSSILEVCQQEFPDDLLWCYKAISDNHRHALDKLFPELIDNAQTSFKPTVHHLHH